MKHSKNYKGFKGVRVTIFNDNAPNFPIVKLYAELILKRDTWTTQGYGDCITLKEKEYGILLTNAHYKNYFADYPDYTHNVAFRKDGSIMFDGKEVGKWEPGKLTENGIELLEPK